MLRTFDITIKIQVPKNLSVQVEQYYISEQVERYKIIFGEKHVRIERRLNERYGWKVLGANYLHFKPQEFAEYMPTISRQIEEAMKPPPKPYVHPKNAT